jgi:hypothetical protein
VPFEFEKTVNLAHLTQKPLRPVCSNPHPEERRASRLEG